MDRLNTFVAGKILHVECEDFYAGVMFAIRRGEPLGRYQMLSLRSLAFILCSAKRLSRAALVRFPDRSKTMIIEQKTPTKMATNIAASMSVSYEQFTASKGRTGYSRAV